MFNEMDIGGEQSNDGGDGQISKGELKRAVKKYFIQCNCDYFLFQGIQTGYDILENPFCQQ